MINSVRSFLAKHNIGIIVAFGAVLRTLGIFSRPIWYDEAFALLFSSTGLAGMLQGTLALDSTGQVSDIHPLGYYLLLDGWTDLFGVSVWRARLLSIILGTLTLLLVYALSKFFVAEDQRWVLLLAVVLSPFSVHYSQEIRMYALMCLGLVLATYALFRGSAENGWRWWVAFAAASALAQYAHQLSAVYLVCLALIPVFQQDWRTTWKAVLGGLGAVLLYLPWLLNLIAQFSSTSIYWVQKPLPSRFLTLFLAFTAGLPVFNGWLLVGFGAAMVLLVFALLASVRIIRHAAPEEKSGFWLVYLALTPPAVLWLISQVRPVFIERALLASSLMFALWIGWLITHRLTPRIERVIMAVVFGVGALIGFGHHLGNRQFPYAPYQSLGSELAETVSEGEVIVHSNKLSFVPMYYYFRDDIPQTFVADPDGQATDTLAVPTQEILGFIESPSIELAAGDANGVWFLIFDQSIKEAEELAGIEHPNLQWLDQHYLLEDAKLWDSLWVMHYIKE